MWDFFQCCLVGWNSESWYFKEKNGKSLMVNNAILDDLQFGCLLFSCEFYMRWRQTSVLCKSQRVQVNRQSHLSLGGSSV